MAAHQSENRTGHLKPHQWRPGTSGNPKGRPRGAGLLDLLTRYAKQRADSVPQVRDKAVGLGLDPSKVTVLEVIALKLLVGAATEDGVSALRTLLERLCGLPVQADILERVERLEELLRRRDADDELDSIEVG